MAHKFDPANFHKLENPERYKEIPPVKTLRKLGLKKNKNALDIGAGTGFFTFAMSEIVGESGHVFATDIEQVMIDEIERKKEEKHSQNITTKLTGESELALSQEMDFILISFVLHEFNELDHYLTEIFKHQKQNGTLAVIEWKKKETPKGPPLQHRLSEDECAKAISKAGWTNIEMLDIHENFYAIKAIKL
jgi:ubiquinone/menaquinone biosynthesis C-methylase UbiE